MSEMNDQNKQQRAIEDVPEYRSVMIQSSASPNMKRLFPLEKSIKLPPILDHSHITRKGESKSPSPSVYRWEQAELPNLPIDYSLVRTNMYVKDSSAQVVADRICNELKNLSIVIDSKGCDTEVR